MEATPRWTPFSLNHLSLPRFEFQTLGRKEGARAWFLPYYSMHCHVADQEHPHSDHDLNGVIPHEQRWLPLNLRHSLEKLAQLITHTFSPPLF